MPYADPEKQREADRKRKARARAEKKAEESEEVRERKPDIRARAWTFIVYPESARELAGCAGQVSPSMGVQSASRSRRKRHRRAEKAHWHILLSFGGKKGYGQIWSISEAINGTRPQVCQDQKR